MKKSLFKGTIYAVSLLCFISIPVSASELEQVQQEKQQIENQLSEAKTNKEQYQAQYYDANNQLQYVISVQNWAYQELEVNQENVQRLVGEIDQLSGVIDKTTADYNRKTDQLKDRLRVMYRNSNSSKLDFLISSGSLSEFFQRVRWLTRVFEKDRQVMADYMNAKMDLDTKRNLVEIEKQGALQTADSMRQDIVNISVNRSYAEERLRITQSNYAYWSQMEEQFAQKSMELQQIIMNLSGGGAYTGGGMAWPTPGCSLITQYYGTFIHPILGVYKNHFAIDIGAQYGTPIVAANGGTVIYCGWIDGYGNTVIIDHGGGISTLYAHASSVTTYLSASVSKGSVIAYIGSTGMSTGPHLHFEVRVNGQCVNPLDYTSP